MLFHNIIEYWAPYGTVYFAYREAQKEHGGGGAAGCYTEAGTNDL